MISLCGECGAKEIYAKGLCQQCYNRRYRQSEAGKAANRRYKQSEASKATVRRYQQSEAGKATVRRYQHSEAGRAVRQRYQQSEEGKAAQRRGARRYHAANPEKKKAQNTFNDALKAGKVSKPELCEFCDDPAQEAHHPDYSKPLEVIWCCREHHKFIHQQIDPYKKAARAQASL